MREYKQQGEPLPFPEMIKNLGGALVFLSVGDKEMPLKLGGNGVRP
jgi:hypothetical protein